MMKIEWQLVFLWIVLKLLISVWKVSKFDKKKFSLLTQRKNPANIYLLKVKIETQEKVWNMFKVNNKNTRTVLLTFHTFF